MRKSLWIMLLLMLTCTAVHAQKFALIDTEYILGRIPAYEQANRQLEQSSKQWQSEVEKLSQEAKALYQSYQNSGKSLSEAQRAKKEEEIVAKEKAAADLRRKYFGPDGELALLQEELLQPLQDDIYEAVKAISNQRGYTLVLDRATAGSIIFASPSIDISNEVLAKLGYSN
ncbi:MAG: OmpH family outer membrane protein [Bacteroides sp.]|nr:OmpH family outer membrane protein [Bacteroides sp.]